MSYKPTTRKSIELKIRLDIACILDVLNSTDKIDIVSLKIAIYFYSSRSRVSAGKKDVAFIALRD